MMTYLYVPFAENYEAKRLGARWNNARKRWYVEDVVDLEPFLRWMPDRLRRSHGQAINRSHQACESK